MLCQGRIRIRVRVGHECDLPGLPQVRVCLEFENANDSRWRVKPFCRPVHWHTDSWRRGRTSRRRDWRAMSTTNSLRRDLYAIVRLWPLFTNSVSKLNILSLPCLRYSLITQIQFLPLTLGRNREYFALISGAIMRIVPALFIAFFRIPCFRFFEGPTICPN